MKVGILYFSGTGATAKIAQVIGNQMDDAGHEVSYFRLKENTSDDTRIGLLEDFDLLGLGAPVYSMRIPRIASKILKELPLPIQKPFFVFSTAHGSWGNGNALWNLYKIAQKREGICLGAFKSYGTNNIRWWRPKTSEPKPANDGICTEFVELAQDFAKRVLSGYKSIVISHSNSPIKLRPNLFWSFWSLLFTYRWEMRLTIGKKRVNGEKCTRCGLCAKKICPSGAITLNDSSFPVFNESMCVGCYGCANLCPTLAIYSNLCKNHRPYAKYGKLITKGLD